MNIINNSNDKYLWGHGYETYQSENKLKEARVINVGYRNHLLLSYDVVLLDTGIEVPGCRVALGSGGFNGNGEAITLEEGTPVLVSFKDGMMQDGYIVGTFNTPGIYKEILEQGNLQKPGELAEDSEFNQPSGHPNRITQIDALFKSMGSKILNTAYDSPEYHSEKENISASRGVPGSIEIRNSLGDIVQYSTGASVTYSDGNIIQVAGGDREEKTTKLLRIAAMHEKRAELMEKKNGIEPDTNPVVGEDGIRPIFKNVSENNPFVLTASYRAQEERKLAKLYREAAKHQSQQASMRLSQANSMQQQFSSEINPTPTNGTAVPANYKPKISKVPPAKNNYGNRRPTPYAPIVVLHETAVSGQKTLEIMKNPKSEVSYHAIVLRNGEVINLAPSQNRAYGAGRSEFKGEKYLNSVNDFAYQISLVSPEDGYWVPNKPTIRKHSGYTEEQYLSLAYMVAKTGVPNERITTHEAVFRDTSTTRYDPVSFDFNKFFNLLAKFPRVAEIDLGIANK
jgi:hypothetical protein